ncbi:unnamed protein product [Adineta steineri]|uniref:Uncharacterized protein n=1 Tax=Adineta steineri TaxID=433720 RepID=A0A818RPZ2_9BILA|nr:unnamed protein product [Adineta steineri]CAF3661030.1 unnamed protein product [Adineta steineri]
MGAVLAIVATIGTIAFGAYFGLKFFEAVDSTRRDATSTAQQAANVVDKAPFDRAFIEQQILNAYDLVQDVLVSIVYQTINVIDDFVRGVAQNGYQITPTSVWSVITLTKHFCITMYLLATATLGIVTVVAFSRLLYLSDFSPFLQAIAWLLLASVGVFIFRMYVQHLRICWDMIKGSSVIETISSIYLLISDDSEQQKFKCDQFSKIISIFNSEKVLITRWILDMALKCRIAGDQEIKMGNKETARSYFEQGATLYQHLTKMIKN